MRENPALRILFSMPIFVLIFYKSYNFELNKNSIIFTAVYLALIIADLSYFYYKIKKEEKLEAAKVPKDKDEAIRIREQQKKKNKKKKK
ncbi:hypothetical protein [Peptacetobacter sp.]|nr:hypothetical protein [Peptacetobacter sp.]